MPQAVGRKENRNFQRYPVNFLVFFMESRFCQVELATREARLPNYPALDRKLAYCQNISIGGLKVWSDAFFPLRQVLRLFIHAAPSCSPLELLAQVTYCQSDGCHPASYQCGLRFVGMDESSMQDLQKFLNNLAPDQMPKRVKRSWRLAYA